MGSLWEDIIYTLSRSGLVYLNGVKNTLILAISLFINLTKTDFKKLDAKG